MAMEPPDPPTVPGQQFGFHDRPEAPAFVSGSAAVPPPMPAPPVTGVPAGPGYPGAGPPFPGGPPPGAWQPGGPIAPPRPRRTGLVVMSMVAGLLLLASGTMTYLWLDTDAELTDTRADLTAEVTELEDAVAEAADEIRRLNGDLSDAEDILSDVEQERDGIENAREALEEDLDTVSNCLDLMFEFLALVGTDQTDEADAMVEELNEACEAADSVIG